MNVVSLSRYAFGGYMLPCTNVITLVNVGQGFLVWTRIVYGSTISTRSIGAKKVAPRSLPCPWARRSSVNFAESALKSSPLWNFTPLRSFTSHADGGTNFGTSAARLGTIFRFGSRSYNVSKMWRPTFDAGLSDWLAMSSVVGSTPCARTTLPAGAAPAATGDRSTTSAAVAIFDATIRSLLERGDRTLCVPRYSRVHPRGSQGRRAPPRAWPRARAPE